MDFSPAFATGPPSSLHKPSVAGRIGNWRARADEGFLMLPIPEEAELVEMSAEAGASRAAWRAQALLGIILGEKDSASFKEAETKGGRAAAGGAGIEWGAGDKGEVAEAEAEAAAEAAATAALRHAMAGATKDASTRVLNDSAGYNDTGKPGVTACGGDGGGGGGGAGNSNVSRWRAIAAAMLGKRAAEQPPPAIPAYDARAAMENTLKAEHDYARSPNTFEAAQGAAHADSHQPRGGGAWWSAWFGDNGRGSAEHGRHYGRMAQQSQAELHTKPDAAAAVAHQSVYATKPRELELSNPPSPFSVSPPSSGACSPPTSASSSSSSASSPESSASAQEGALPEPCYLHEDGRAGGSGAEGGGSSEGFGEGEAGGRSRPDAEAPVVGSFMGFAMRGAAGSAAARRRAAAVPRAQREGEWAVWGIGFAVFALVNVQLITGCALLWLCLPEAWSATARAAVAGCASALVAAQLVGNVVVAAFARAAVLREFLRRKMKAAGKAQGVAVGGRRGAGRAEDGEAAEVAGRGEAVAACGVACALDVEQLLAEQGEGGNDGGDKQMMKGFHSRPLLVTQQRAAPWRWCGFLVPGDGHAASHPGEQHSTLWKGEWVGGDGWEEVGGRRWVGGGGWEEMGGRRWVGGGGWEEVGGRRWVGGGGWEEVGGRRWVGGDGWEEMDGRRWMGGDGWAEMDGRRWVSGDGWEEMGGRRWMASHLDSLLLNHSTSPFPYFPPPFPLILPASSDTPFPCLSSPAPTIWCMQAIDSSARGRCGHCNWERRAGSIYRHAASSAAGVSV
ncbi:unnamed protein product [Closterium sp. Naga37s-1]|nr:unnamed protein product [Closterium sp. Naga37s-1]